MKKSIFALVGVVMAGFLLTACGEKQLEVAPLAVLSDSMITVELGKTHELTVENYTGETRWASSDERVVTVSETGVVTPVSIGTAAVTAYIENEENMSCAVEVTAGTSNVQSISVTSYYSDVSDVTLDYNSAPTIHLKATCVPDDPSERLTWSSSDERIAQVSQSGAVTGYDNGRVEITVTALNGVSGTCTVRLKNVPETAKQNMPEIEMEAPRIESSHTGNVTSAVPVSAPNAQSTIIISDSNIYLNIGEGFKLTAAVGNAPGNNTISWLSSDKAVAIVKNGRVVAVGEGRCVISAVTSDGAVASATVAVGKDAIKALKAENSEK